MFSATVTYLIQSGHEDQAVELFATLTKLTQQEPDNILYFVDRSPKNPRCFFLYERYTDKEAFTAHCTSESFKQYVTHGLHLICESRHYEEYEPLH